MITAIKSFGSYKLSRATDALVHLEVEDKTYKSTCTIPNTWTDLELLEIRPYNDDTSIFRFRLPENELFLHLPIGSFLLVKAPDCEHGGGDAIRPYTSISIDNGDGCFEIICKRYKEWGVKEDELKSSSTFLFIKTDHSYRPAGAVSNYIHNLKVGQKLQFKHTSSCRGKLSFPFDSCVDTLIMLAVGIGVAPMINTLRTIFNDENRELTKNITNITLLYGVREVKDILLKELLEEWRIKYASRGFRVVYCIGSRWNQVLMGAKTKNEFIPPPLPKGYADLLNDGLPVELGWINEDKLIRHTPIFSAGHLAMVCGLPGVYDKLCGPRTSDDVGGILQKLGYNNKNVIKM
jgi:cytochrome-b5 reductase